MLDFRWGLVLTPSDGNHVKPRGTLEQVVTFKKGEPAVSVAFV